MSAGWRFKCRRNEENIGIPKRGVNMLVASAKKQYLLKTWRSGGNNDGAAMQLAMS